MTFNHGTNLESATLLFSGAKLDAVEATRRKIDGPPGFFLATEVADAEYFALRRIVGVVLRYTITDGAMRELLAHGAVQRPIPRGRASPFFLGDELFVPSGAFETFDEMRANGEITVILD